MEFKPGDKVFVRHHTQDEKETYKLVWVSAMDQLEGKLCEIQCMRSEDICTVKYGPYRYNLFTSSLTADTSTYYEQF